MSGHTPGRGGTPGRVTRSGRSITSSLDTDDVNPNYSHDDTDNDNDDDDTDNDENDDDDDDDDEEYEDENAMDDGDGYNQTPNTGQYSENDQTPYDTGEQTPMGGDSNYYSDGGTTPGTSARLHDDGDENEPYHDEDDYDNEGTTPGTYMSDIGNTSQQYDTNGSTPLTPGIMGDTPSYMGGGASPSDPYTAHQQQQQRTRSKGASIGVLGTSAVHAVGTHGQHIQQQQKRKQKTRAQERQGGAYGGQQRTSKLRLGRRPELISYDDADMSRPFPLYYECACFFQGQFFCVTIEKFMETKLLNETQKYQIAEQQIKHAIPQPFCPETIPYDYSKHEYSYYVHFSRWDRRLDQWVTRDRLRCMHELVRYLQPYSLKPGAVGKISVDSIGFNVERPVMEVLQPRYPGMRFFYEHSGSPPDCSQPQLNPAYVATLTKEEQLLSPTQQLSILLQKQDLELGLSPTNKLGSYTLEQLQAKRTELFFSPLQGQGTYLVPCIIPVPLPIVPVLSPELLNNASHMQKYSERYEESVSATVLLVLNTPLKAPGPNAIIIKPPTILPDGTIVAGNSVNDDNSTNVTKRGRGRGSVVANADGGGKKTTGGAGKKGGKGGVTPQLELQHSMTDSNNNNNNNNDNYGGIQVDHSKFQLFPDKWYGPKIKVELPEEAILAYGPDTEREDHILATKTQTSQRLVLGKYDLQPWYFSPLPNEYIKSGTLWMCEFCLQPFAYEEELQWHMKKCSIRHPPGHEIYRSVENNCEIAMFEVDGALEVKWCENLSYLAKLFLDHKTLYEDCSAFLYYVLCEMTPRGYTLLGYYSKFKFTDTENLACILTLPQYQGKGYGKFLISFSYELTKIDGHKGSPERPLSDLGRVSYIAYWTECAIKVIAYLYKLKMDCTNNNANAVQSGQSTTSYAQQIHSLTHIPGMYLDLATFTESTGISKATMAQIERVDRITIDLISRLTMIKPEELIEALQEKEVLISQGHNGQQWCLNWRQIQSIIQNVQKKKNDFAQRLSQMSPEQRAKHQSLRLAIPSLIRWRPWIKPQETKSKRVPREEEEDDETPAANTRHSTSHAHHRSTRNASSSSGNSGGVATRRRGR